MTEFKAGDIVVPKPGCGVVSEAGHRLPDDHLGIVTRVRIKEGEEPLALVDWHVNVRYPHYGTTYRWCTFNAIMIHTPPTPFQKAVRTYVQKELT